MPNNKPDTTNDTTEQLVDDARDGAKRVGGLAGTGVNKATRKAQRAAKETAKKFMRKATKSGIKFGAKAAVAIFKIILKLLLLLWKPLLIILAIFLVIWLVSGWFVDEEFESKAEIDNYQTESISEDNPVTYDLENARYKVLDRSNGNKLFKMFYGYMAQRGYWKIEVDENGNPIGDLMRGDEKKAQEMVDKYNREKKFIMNSDLLYLLDVNLNSRMMNEFFFPEQFVQPVYHDENYNLKQLTNEDGELIVKSTKYDKKTQKPTDKKEIGVWDYGFGSIMQYQAFKEQRERRAELRQTYRWDPENKELVLEEIPPGEGKKIKESVDGYPKKVYMIRKVTNAIGTIENDIIFDWKKTNEKWTKKEKIMIDAEKEEKYYETVHETNKDGEPLYWMYDPSVIEEKFNQKTTEETEWPITYEEEKTRWVPTKLEVEQTYKGYVWEKVPQYSGEPNTDGIVGDRYIFDYLTNYEAFIPNVVMESFDIERRTGKEIEGLEEIWKTQEAVENVESDYDAAPGTFEPQEVKIGSNSNSTSYTNALQYLREFEIYGKRYGVDPYLLLAIAAQESSGLHEQSKKSSGGYGLMQIEEPGRVITSAKALNFETGKEETMIISGPGDVDSVEDNIRAGAMLAASRLRAWDHNIAVGLQAYNFGTGAMGIVIDKYAEQVGSTRSEVIKNYQDLGWQSVVIDFHQNPHKYLSNWSYKTYGDPNYISNVMRYYGNPSGETPWVLDKEGNKHSMDGSIQVGAAIVGNGTGLNTAWFTSLISALEGKWNELFNDSPSDALMNKDDYTWTRHTNRMTEEEYKEFLTLYRTFLEGKEYSEIDEEWTLEDWKREYESLFENPTIEGVIDEETLEEYEELMKHFPDGLILPAEKVSKIKNPYNGRTVTLSVGKNTDVLAMINGKVTKSNVKDGVVEITQENGVKVIYTGLKKVSVKKGDYVKQGDVIAVAKTDLGIGFESSKGNNFDPTPFFTIMGDGTQNYNYTKVLSLIESVKGYPYNMVGDANHPSRGYFDCSGLIQWAFGEVGVKLPRTANEQYNHVLKIDASQARPGDLIFFEGTYTTSRPITHVGLYIGNGQFWNAQGMGVRLASLKNDPDIGDYWSGFRYHFGRIK